MPEYRPQYLQFLCRRRFKHRKNLKIITVVAVDTEIDPATGQFILGHAFGEIQILEKVKGKQVKRKVRIDEYFKSEQALWDFINGVKRKRFAPCKFVFFNASFDLKYIHDLCDNVNRLKNGTRVIHIKTKNGIDIEDIGNHAKGSLENWVDTMKMQNAENNLCKETIYKTKYVKGMPYEELKQHCRWDAMATWELAMFFENMFNELGTEKKLTMAQNALDYFTKAFMEDDEGNPIMFSRIDPKINPFLFQAMRGGRVEAYERYEHEIAAYDINSMYVSIMKRIQVPDPGYGGIGYPVLVEQAESDWRFYYDNYYTVVEATVEYPLCHKPMLPYYDEENLKMLFPCGVFRGTWHSPELKEAERRGCKILKCHSYIWYKKTIPLFKGYAEWVWAKRMEAREKYKKGSPQEIFFKDMGNGVFGKFAQRNPVGEILCKYSEWEDLHPGEDLPANAARLKKSPEYIYGAPTGKVDSIHCFPEIAGCITCHARLMIAGVNLAIDESKDYTGIYSDTDSIKVARKDGGFITDEDLAEIAKIINVGNELGQLKYEGQTTLYPLVAKGYLEVTAHYLDGRPFVRIKENEEEKKDCGVTWKGVKKNAEFEINYVKEGDTWVPENNAFHAEFEKPYRELEALKQGHEQNQFRNVERDGTTEDTKRVWVGKMSTPHVLTSDEEIIPYSDEAERELAEIEQSQGFITINPIEEMGR